ncbi:MAG: hypothetical protein IJH37_09365 [Clostridia bacterium]|nr:hypothetical protein [Clostridia bacterium]
MNTKYEAALKADDNPSIIKYGNELIALMRNVEDSDEKRDILVTRYNAVGKAYAAMGDYDNSAVTFKALYDCGSANSYKYYDYLVSAKARTAQYASDIRMYTEGGKSPYYGAKNERQNGVLFGVCSNGGIRSKLDNESMILIYQELGQTLLSYNKSMVSSARSSGCAVEFALNCPNQGKDISDIKKMGSYLKEISELFDKYSDVPVFLRFAAEFDIWDKNLTDPESYKAAFRYVSEYFKSRNSNVAMVWSPNQVSRWDIDIDDYYPGDAYVDWVGMSLYAQKYFLGSKSSSEENEIVFKTGINSEPVIAVKDIIDKYGSRKPIMISESGCGHYVKTQNENTTEFALRRLKEYYSYLPMVYPQIKLIAYFDYYVDGETNDFRLSSNNTLCNEYLRLTKTGRFVQDSFNNSTDLCYREITDGINLESVFSISCYAHSYNDTLKSVAYYIDGKYLGMSNEIPFTTYIDAAGYFGKHSLSCVALFESGKTLTRDSTVNIGEAGKGVKVNISGKTVSFDQEPIIYNDRTMVPMRKIFEALGADVNWDGNSKTASGKRGDRTVKITVGSKKMYVNSKVIDLDAPSFVLSDRTLVPVRAIAEGLGCDVEWDNRTYTVDITPKVFKWSEWMKKLPENIDADLYYIEKKEQYRYRDKEYFELSNRYSLAGNYVRTETSYGDWSEWQSSYISENEGTEVQTRTQSSPVSYHYAHWCTGDISDSSHRYRTSNYKFCDEAIYHDLGWFDSPLPYSEDSDSDYTHYINGEKHRCSNSCWRWYLVETSGGDYTEYRYRKIYRKYIYWQWGDWSEFSDREPDYSFTRDVETRILYRYKEK